VNDRSLDAPVAERSRVWPEPVNATAGDRGAGIERIVRGGTTSSGPAQDATPPGADSRTAPGSFR
jgi:hypothetical protein